MIIRHFIAPRGEVLAILNNERRCVIVPIDDTTKVDDTVRFVSDEADVHKRVDCTRIVTDVYGVGNEEVRAA